MKESPLSQPAKGADTIDERMPVEAILARMREVLGVKTDAELSRSINISRTAISSWKRRGAIPLEKSLLVAQRGMISLEYILTGHGTLAMYKWSSEVAFGLVIYLYEKCRSSLRYGDQWNTCLWWARVFPNLVQWYENEVTQIRSANGLEAEAAAAQLRKTIDELDPGELLNTIKARF